MAGCVSHQLSENQEKKKNKQLFWRFGWEKHLLWLSISLTLHNWPLINKHCSPFYIFLSFSSKTSSSSCRVSGSFNISSFRCQNIIPFLVRTCERHSFETVNEFILCPLCGLPCRLPLFWCLLFTQCMKYHGLMLPVCHFGL